MASSDETPFRTEGSIWIGKTIRRQIDHDDPDAPGAWVTAVVTGWLDAHESDFNDDNGKPAALWRVEFKDAPLKGDTADLELAELNEGASQETLTAIAAASPSSVVITGGCQSGKKLQHPWGSALKPCSKCKGQSQGGVYCRIKYRHETPNHDGTPWESPPGFDEYIAQHGEEPPKPRAKKAPSPVADQRSLYIRTSLP